ncbi:uncharacterized protein LOC143453133 [Clavelina lepadiformis]|uniref:uncharacterized protein LOC143453133 n=1 Tax=Clavelina lepadiformis TaxID=159417 RepID=UPI0040415ED3
MGICLLHQKQYGRSLKYFQESSSILRQLPSCENVILRDCFYNSGLCWFNQSKYRKSLNEFQKALKIYNSLPADDVLQQVSCCHYRIALCLFNLKQYEEAKWHFDKTIKNKITLEQNTFEGIDFADLFLKAGVCAEKTNCFQEAVGLFKQAVAEYELVNADPDNDVNIADASYRMGLCLRDLLRYDEAEQKLQLALRIFDTNMFKEDIADCLFQIALCKKQLNSYDEGVIYFEKSLGAYKLLSEDAAYDLDIDHCLYGIVKCLGALGYNEPSTTSQLLEVLDAYHRRVPVNIVWDRDILECKTELRDILNNTNNESLA